jgi:hypothetical protein
MNVHIAYQRYLDAAKATESPTWRTVYVLGLMCAIAISYGDLVAFVGNDGYGSDWPDPRLTTSS